MSEHFNDAKAERLALSGFDGQLNDAEQQWLKDRVGWQPGDSESLADLYGLFLELQGFSGQRNDAMYAWLGSIGHNLSDQISDRLYDFWSSTEVLP